jgi:hypothetical protein
MSWKTEHGKDFEVPGLIDYMVKEGILKDISWHNDTKPRFVIEDPDDDQSGVTIWVDHPIQSERELQGERPRFHVQAGEIVGESIDEIETDDLEKAVTTALEYGEKHITKAPRVHFDKLVKAWVKSTGR